MGYVGPQDQVASAVSGAKSYQGGGTQIQFVDFDNRASFVKVIGTPKKVGG